MIGDVTTQKTSLEVSLIKLTDRILTIPTSGIVEVVPVTMPQVVAKMPRWFLGFLPWQGARIPFVSFEALCGASFKINSGSNVLVLKTVNPTLQNKFIGLLIQDVPISCSITKDLVTGIVGELSAYELNNVKISDYLAKIPDISSLEKLLIDTGVLS